MSPKPSLKRAKLRAIGCVKNVANVLKTDGRNSHKLFLHSYEICHKEGLDRLHVIVESVLLVNVSPLEFDQTLSHVQTLSIICPAYD